MPTLPKDSDVVITRPRDFTGDGRAVIARASLPVHYNDTLKRHLDILLEISRHVADTDLSGRVLRYLQKGLGLL